MKKSIDYHDYVFKDGKLVGKFDEMYQHSSEIPWHQDKTAYSVFSDIDIAILRQFKYDSICEIGCGLGFFTNRLYKELNNCAGGRPIVTGVDISETAIHKASKQFPEIRFVVGDLIKENPFNPLSINDEQQNMSHTKFELVIIKEVLWYVCHKLELFMQNVISLLKKNGFLYVSQSFPETENWVGKDVLDSPEKLKEMLCRYAAPIHYCVEYDWNYNARPLVHFLGRKLNED